jgi:hypothetical protein
MNPVVRYTLARLGLFLVLFLVLALIPIPLNIFVKALIALLLSAAASYFLLRGMRDEVATQLSGAVERRAEQKQRLRDALAGDEDEQKSSDQA